MHPVARVIKPQDKTLVRNNWQMRLLLLQTRVLSCSLIIVSMTLVFIRLIQ
jgi:hypothetical protein